jgi:hypothetical protein
MRLIADGLEIVGEVAWRLLVHLRSTKGGANRFEVLTDLRHVIGCERHRFKNARAELVRLGYLIPDDQREGEPTIGTTRALSRRSESDE